MKLQWYLYTEHNSSQSNSSSPLWTETPPTSFPAGTTPPDSCSRWTNYSRWSLSGRTPLSWNPPATVTPPGSSWPSCCRSRGLLHSGRLAGQRCPLAWSSRRVLVRCCRCGCNAGWCGGWSRLRCGRRCLLCRWWRFPSRRCCAGSRGLWEVKLFINVMYIY